MMDPIIKLCQLTKRYGAKTVVNELSLNVYKGELFCFLGPNGSGKTTTMKMLCGLLKPSKGSAEILTIDVWKDPINAKKKFAYVPDQPNMYEKLTGEEYLRFIASIFEVDDHSFNERKETFINLFELTGRTNELIESYSHGMRQKINLCAALIHKPDVLFLDEPTVGLDPKGARTLKNLLRQLCDEEGLTVFMTTHILEIAEQMCDRVAILSQGHLLASGTMDELRQQGGQENSSLEELFLSLTSSDEDTNSVVNELKGEDN